MTRSLFGTPALTLVAALAVLLLGVRLAREKELVVSEESRVQRVTFTAQVLRKTEELSQLYEQHLVELSGQIPDLSSIEITSQARDLTGIEQITVFDIDDRKQVLEIDRSPREDQSSPILAGSGSDEPGLILDPTDSALHPAFQWVKPPGYSPHFVTRKYGRLIAIRTSEPKVASAMDGWLQEWASQHLEPLEINEVALSLRSPSQEIIAQTSRALDSNAESAPSVLIPIPSVFGTWQITSRDHTETKISYHPAMLFTAFGLAIFISVIGGLAWFQQRETLQRAEQRVSFVNQVSHELRTPLTNILLNLDLAQDLLKEDRPDEMKRRLSLIREEASRLSRLLGNVLTFAHRKKTEPALAVSTCRVDTALQDVLAQFAPSLSRQGMEVVKSERAENLEVLSEPDALHQILSNLISNVEKYAAQGGVFEIETDQLDRKTALIVISDHGPGIATRDVARIFQPFVRLNDSTSEGVSGTGIGLTIARRLAERMEGKLQVKNRPDGTRGARFELTLPIAPSNILSLVS